jgi:phage shock protein A
MRQSVVRQLANGLFLYTDSADQNAFLYPSSVVVALGKLHDDDLLAYKRELVDARDQVDNLRQALETATARVEPLTKAYEDLRSRTNNERAQLESELVAVRAELAQANKYAKQLTTRLKHAGPRGVERPRSTRTARRRARTV